MNLERALTLQSRLGGHLVSGHIDTTARLSKIEKCEECWRLTFDDISLEQKEFLIPKGSICLDGVSLTINKVYESSFEVMMIPHTFENTHLKNLLIGDLVNVEFDMIHRMVKSSLKAHFKNVRNDL